ncbi:MAG: hypothetical protein AB1505_00135 [Candidatus Latescibacterota bacterium]
MYAILAFDTEDIYFPPEDHIDDIPGWLAQIMTEVGLTGTFFVMGEKAEELLARGRQDVLERMQPHDIASHQQGNRYPLLPQVVEGKTWEEGVAAVRQYEAWVTEQHLRAFGKQPIGLSRHNCYFAPQHIAVAGEGGLPYMYTVTQIPGSRQPLWFANAVTFPSEGPNTFAGFDRIFSRDEVFEAHLARLQTFIGERLQCGDEWVLVFGCHPVQVMAREWLEHYTLGSGRARTPQELGWHYRAKPREEEARAQANFRRLCQLLKDHPDVEVVGMSEAARRFSTQPERVDRDALVSWAGDVLEKRQIPFHSTFSPAELVHAMAESLAHCEASGDLPEQVVRHSPLGPTTRPVVAREVVSVTRAELVAACRQVVGEVERRGHLPANVEVPGGRLGIGQATLLLSRSYLAQARYDRYDRLSVSTGPRYPLLAYELDAWVRRHIGDHWALPLDFSCESLAGHARLQTWTLKPAWLRPPQGPVAEGEYAGRVAMGTAQ